MKRLNQIFAVILSLVIALMAIPMTVSAAEITGKCGDNLEWSFSDDGRLYISGEGKMDSYDKYHGEGFINAAPWINLDVYEVSIAEGVTSIGQYAFGHSEVHYVSISETVTEIEACAFAYSDVESVYIPNSVEKIGEAAFKNSGLYEVYIMSGVKTIDDSAFYGTKLKNVKLPNSITKIGDHAFDECENLKTITFVGTEEEWNKIDFSGENEVLENIKVEFEPIKSSGSCGENVNWTYDDKTYTLTLSGTGKMDNYESCRYDMCEEHKLCTPWSQYLIKNVVIEHGVTNIGSYAFGGEEFRTETISLPDSVMRIEDDAFSDCYSVKKIDIPNSVTYIGYAAFSSCDSLESVVIPDGITEISEFAFSECYSLKEVVIPDSVITINRCAFSQCYSLENVVIPDGVKMIGSMAFYGSSKLKEIKIPSSVEIIGDGAFQYCDELSLVYFMGSKDDWDFISFGKDNEILTECDIHFFDAAPTRTEPTCTEKGLLQYECTCHADFVSYTEELAPLGHSYEDGVCKNCGEKEIDDTSDAENTNKWIAPVAIVCFAVVVILAIVIILKKGRIS